MLSKVKKLVVFLGLFVREFHKFAVVYCHDFSPYVVVFTFDKTRILSPHKL